MKQIIITIKNGQATVATSGFAGASCTAETAELEQALGVTVADQKTPEYWAQVVAPQQVKAGR